MTRSNKYSLVSLLVLILSSCVMLHAPALLATSPATDSADIDPETIKENIKRRIEQVIKVQSENNKKRLAFVGALNSVTTNSFSLEIDGGGIKQASTSASTVVVEMQKNKEMKLEDISIGDYIAALGFLNDSTDVLDTRRILVLKTKPEPSDRKSIVGIVKSLDPKKNLLTVKTNTSADEIVFKISSKANLSITDSTLKKTKISVKEISLDAPVLIIYEPAASDQETNLATSILVKSSTEIDLPSPAPSASPSATPKASATPKPKTSPTPKPTKTP